MMNELQIRQMQISAAKDEIRCCNELNQIYGLKVVICTAINKEKSFRQVPDMIE